MKCDVSKENLIELVFKQLNNFFLDIDREIIVQNIDTALDRAEKCFEAIENRYYQKNDKLQFHTFHSGQYSIFLYYLSNTIYKTGITCDMPDKIYYLNKIMNGVDWFYEITLPDIFGVEHPVGSVLGRATYSDKFFVYQGVTVGGNQGCYPSIGENVILYSNATVIGKTILGNNVVISSGCYIKDENIPDCSIVFGKSPNLVVKRKKMEYLKTILPLWKYT